MQQSYTSSARFNFRIILVLFFLTSWSSWATAQTGEALHFASGDYIDLGNSLGNFGTGQFTFETWFKTSAGTQTLVSKRSGCAASSFWNVRLTATGEVSFEVCEAAGPVNLFSVVTPGSYIDNQWHHVACVRNGTNMRIHMDGYIVATLTTPVITSISNTALLKIGQSSCSNFVGWMDETRLYSGARTECSVYTNRLYEYESPSANLLFEFHYNQGTANGNNAGVTTIQDSGAAGNEGTLVGFSLTGTTSNWTGNGSPAQGLLTQPAVGVTVDTACTSYLWNGTTYTSSGTYLSTFTSVSGCDSISSLDLTIAKPISGGNQSACVGATLNPTAFSKAYASANQSNTSGGILWNGNAHWQSFTPSVNGSLNKVSLELRSSLAASSTSFEMTIYEGEGTSGVLIGTSTLVTLPAGSGYAYSDFDLSHANIYLRSGETYTFRMVAQNGFDQPWIRASNADPYANGRHSASSTSDMKFITYMTPILWYATLTGGSSIPNPSATSTTTFYAEVQAGSCTTSRTAVLLSFNAVALTVSGDTSLCPGESTSLTATGAVSYVWMPGSTTGSTRSVSPASTTTYTITGTNSFGCTLAVTKTVVVNNLPIVSISGLTAVTCPGYNITLTASGANSYTWNPGASTNSSVTFFPTTTTTYTVTGTNAAGCTNADTHVVNVPVLTLNVSPVNPTVCFGKSTTLTASGMSSYNWIPGNIQNSFLTVSPTVNTSYTVVGTDANGCSKVSSVTVLILSNPLVTVSGNSQVCTNASATLNASGAASFNWMPGNVSGSTKVFTIPSSTIYTVTGTANNGCTATATYLVTALPLPTVGVTASDSSICVGQTTTLSGNGGLSYSWLPGNQTGATLSVAPTSIATYTVTGTDANLCSNTSSITISIADQLIAQVVALSDSAFCTGGSVFLYTTPFASASTLPTCLPTTQVISPALVVSGSSGTKINRTCPTGYVAVGYKGRSGSLIDNFQLACRKLNGNGTLEPTVVYTAALGTSAGGSAVGPFLLSGNNMMVGLRAFTISSNNNFSAFRGFGQSALHILAQDSNSLSPISIATMGPFTTNTIGTQYAPNGYVVIGMRGPNQFFPTSIELISVPLAQFFATSYSWTNGSTVSSTQVSTGGIQTVTMVDGNGCTSTASKGVIQYPLPTVTANASATPICVGNSVTLQGGGAATYSWNNSVTNNSSFIPYATKAYQVVGVDANGCSNTSSIQVIVNPCGTTTHADVKLFIQGYYMGSGMMQETILNQGNISGANETDTITVELRDHANTATIIRTAQAVLHTDGTASANFSSLDNGFYFIVVKHRNAIETWSAQPVLISNSSTYDFSTAADQAYGDNQIEVETGTWAFYSGDIASDGAVDALDYLLLDSDITAGAYGYSPTDLTGDGYTDAFDYLILDPNLINGIGALTP
jgi:hypothetical protein